VRMRLGRAPLSSFERLERRLRCLSSLSLSESPLAESPPENHPAKTALTALKKVDLERASWGGGDGDETGALSYGLRLCGLFARFPLTGRVLIGGMAI
jgi:hypothetical protein